jgi:predicted nuclease with TOPRIM domain
MNKSLIGWLFLVGITVLGANEFTKKPNRKEKVQQESAYNDCVQAIDSLIGQACRIQEKLAQLTGKLYKKLRSCAVEEKPELAQKEAAELRSMEKTLAALHKQLSELETAVLGAEKIA